MRSVEKLRNQHLLRQTLLWEVAQVDDALRWLDTQGAKHRASLRNRHPHPWFKQTGGQRTTPRGHHGVEEVHISEPGSHSGGLG